MSGGGGGLISNQLLGPMGAASATNSGVGYTNPRDSVGDPYVPSYTPQTATPFLQSLLAQQGGSPLQQGSNFGLPSLQSMFNMPQRGAPYQATGLQQLTPMAPYVGSMYRPDMSAINKNLSNVAPSVEMQQRQAAEEAARQEALKPVSQGMSSGDSGGGG
jgi:hypothetical protein